MRAMWEDAALAVLTALVGLFLGLLAALGVLGASMSGGDYPRTSSGEWVVALGAAAVAVAAPALVALIAWRRKLWLTMAAQALLFLALAGLALSWGVQSL
ncbi:hypothetical protein [Streptomyces sp. RTGN2]|uniref:hypothetical protein n=1 Tax=Streptomyces sp. RTGN2 TaxID=3016525 RepID=UPI0025543DF6|nr:hypothetical protein [Streptomyces sp. RTGN2]